MRRLKIGMFCLLVSIVAITCKKEHLTTQTTINNAPVFSFTGLVDGVAMNFEAGVNNYYMYSSYTQDTNGVYNYTGNLKEFNCTSGCPPGIEFIINDYRTLATGANETNIAKGLDTGYFNYLVPGGTPTAFSMTFYPTQGATTSITSYTWNFGDGTSSTIVNSTLSNITHPYSHPGNYTSSLSVNFSDSTTSSLNNPIQMGNSKVTLTCSIPPDTDSLFTCKVSGGSGYYAYHWDFGDTITTPGDTSDSSNPTYTYSNKNKIYTVTLKVTDIHNPSLIANAKTYVAPPGGSGINQQHFISYYTSAPTLSPNSYGLSNITIIYTDATGDIYTSNNSLQPDTSNFHITSVSNYQNNESGQTTKQLHIKFNCTLFDSKANKLAIKNGDAIIAVAYK
ncbi:MAG: PKD domain-containing protein [Bacteroidia bacterium]